MFAHFNLILLSTSHVLTSGYTSDMRRLKHLKVFMWITHIWSSKFSDLLLKSFLSSGNHLLSCVDRVDAVGSCTIWNCTVDNTWIIFKIFNSWLVFKLFFFAFFMCTFSCPIDACLVVFKIFLSMASEYRLSDAWVRTVECVEKQNEEVIQSEVSDVDTYIHGLQSSLIASFAHTLSRWYLVVFIFFCTLRYSFKILLKISKLCFAMCFWEVKQQNEELIWSEVSMLIHPFMVFKVLWLLHLLTYATSSSLKSYFNSVCLHFFWFCVLL